jgi:hypothetical protein
MKPLEFSLRIVAALAALLLFLNEPLPGLPIWCENIDSACLLFIAIAVAPRFSSVTGDE